MDIELMLVRAIESSSTFPNGPLRDRERFTGCGIATILGDHIERRRSILSEKAPDDQARLRAFIANLSPYVGRELVGGCLWTPTHRYWVWVDPKEERLLHWEEYARSSRTNS
jgi:hypothetical protein